MPEVEADESKVSDEDIEDAVERLTEAVYNKVAMLVISYFIYIFNVTN